jgi:ligand-binding sensor domain-containing protein
MLAKHTLIFILTSLLSVTSGYSQATIQFKSLSVTDGLSQNSINAICQDQRGFIWIGTFDGLNRYDGYSFQVYRNKAGDTTSLRSNAIFSLYEDRAHRLWIGTLGGGLHLFLPERDAFQSYNLGLEKNVIRCFFEDSRGNFWIGTNDGLLLFDPDKKKVLKRITHNPQQPASICSNLINDICEDRDQNLWIATPDAGLDRLDNKTGDFIHHTHTGFTNTSLSDNNLTRLYAAPDGFVWIGTRNKGLLRFNPATNEFLSLPVKVEAFDKDALAHFMVTCILPESSDKLWIGTQGGGLSLLDSRTLTYTHYRHVEDDKGSLSKNVISSIFKDKRKNLWIGTTGGGLNFHDRKRKPFFVLSNKPSDKNSLSKNSVLSVIEDHNRKFWIGTDEGGLNYFDKEHNQITRFTFDPSKPHGLSHHVVSDLLEDRDANIWIGFSSNGIDRYSPTTNIFRHYSADMDGFGRLSSSWIFCLYQDRKGRIWAGTNGGGLNLFDPKSTDGIYFMHNENIVQSISNNYVTDVLEDSRGRLWVGTWEGLNLYDETSNSFIRFMHRVNDSSSISSNSISCLFEDRKNNLWIGTYAGLNRWDEKTNTFQIYNEQNGLPNNVICGILEDKKGNLWLSSYLGLSRFNPTTGACRNYDQSDGLQGNQFNDRSCTGTTTGEMMFGGINGLTWFNPDSILEDSLVPNIEFTGFRLYNKPVLIGAKGSPLRQSIWEMESMDLKYNQSTFTFEFVALNYSASSKCRYKYMLENFDRSWIDNGNIRSASYTNVPPGRYTFRVIASNSDGVWNEKGISIHINVSQPPWKQAWVRIVMVLILSSLVLLVHTYRVNQIKRQKNLLESKVEQRTVQVRAQKEELEKQADRLERANLEIINKNIHLEYQKEEIERQAGEIKRMNFLLRQRNEDLSQNVKDLSRARVMEKRVSYDEFREIYPDDNACYLLIRELKQNMTFDCAKCESKEFYSLDEGHFFRRCKKCGYRESITANTIFFHLKFPVAKAFYILYLVSSGRDLTVEELSKLIDLRKETCWAFRNKIKAMMASLKRIENPNEGWKELILLPKKTTKKPDAK